MLPLDGLGMDASGNVTPESLADPPEGWCGQEVTERSGGGAGKGAKRAGARQYGGTGSDCERRLLPPASSGGGEAERRPAKSRRRPGRSEEDLESCRRRATLAQELGGEMQVDVVGLGEPARRVAVVACSLELLFTPQEYPLGFRVEFENLKFCRSHRVEGFGRDARSVLPLAGDLYSADRAIRSASASETSASRRSVRLPTSHRSTFPASRTGSVSMFWSRSK